MKLKALTFFFLLFLLLTVTAKSGEEYLREEAEKGLDEVLGGEYQNIDYGYYDVGKGLAVSCNGGQNSISCKERPVSREGEFYYVGDPTLNPHSLDIDKEQFMIFKFLGHMVMVKPEKEGSDFRFDVFSWAPNDSFFDDGAGTIEECCSVFVDEDSIGDDGILSTIYTGRIVVEDCEGSCGARFSVGPVSLAYGIAGKDISLSKFAFTSEKVREIEASTRSSSEFTIFTRILDPEEEIHDDISEKFITVAGGQSSYSRKRATLEDVSFVFDAAGLKRFHGVYSFVPFLYWPKLLDLEGNALQDDQDVSFRVFLDQEQLDCSGWNPSVTASVPVGSEGRCDSSERNGVIKYKVVGIRGPFYKIGRKLAWGPFKIADFYSMVGDDPIVEIDLSFKFLLSEDGEVNEYSDWISSQEELEELLGRDTDVDQYGNVPQGDFDSCEPSIYSIRYNDEDLVEPESFEYESFGDVFSAIVVVGEGCDLKDVYLGLWDSENLSGRADAKIDFFSWEVDLMDLHGVFSKDVSLSKADYPRTMYLAAKVFDVEGNTFKSEPVEFLMPVAGGSDDDGSDDDSGDDSDDDDSDDDAPIDVESCDPCSTVTGCLACIDLQLVDGSLR